MSENCDKNFFDSLLGLLFETFGEVTRARGKFLYTKRGARILDLYLSGGAGILGHRNKANLTFKNTLDRVDCALFRTRASGSLQKAVSAYLGRPVQIAPFFSKEAAKAFCNGRGEVIQAPIETLPLYIAVFDKAGECFDKVSGKASDKAIDKAGECFCKAGGEAFGEAIGEGAGEASDEENGETSSGENCGTSDKAINKAGGEALNKVIYDGGGGTSSGDFGSNIALPQTLSAPIEALAARSFYNLLALKNKEETGLLNLGSHDELLEKWWAREGFLLTPKIGKSEYEDFAKKALVNARVFVSPIYESPSIVPWDVEAGALRALGKL